ncbi:MAG: hypothetical protein ABSB42_04755 [Tepidisphaeraceae bacterium]|jgi:hypothetical protein
MDHISIWRTTVLPGDPTYIWSRSGHLPNGGDAGFPARSRPYTLDDSILLKPFTWSDTGSSIDAGYATGLSVPADAPPGTYRLHVSGLDTGMAITVASPRPPRPVVTVDPTGNVDSANIQAALSAGKDVKLSPGVFTIDSAITIPEGAAVRGAHRDVTILKRVPKDSDYGWRVFTSTGGQVSFSDFTLEGAFAPGAILLHNNLAENRGIVVQRLRLLQAQLLQLTSTEVFVEDVEFKRSGGIIGGDHHLWKDISFEGRCRFNHECLAVGDQFAIINASWRDTARGMVLRQGPQNAFFSRLVFEGIQYSNNGDEVILSEDIGGPGLLNCMFFHVRVRNCDGAAIELWVTPAINNLFYGVQVNGGQGIWLHPDNKVRQTDNVFENVELRGCQGINLDGATGNTFKGLAIISPRPTWANQGYFTPAYYPPISSAIRGSAGNVFNPMVVRDLPEGWTAKD